jgi:hypothetical protein
MKSAILGLLIVSTQFAFAGTGQGAVVCSLPSGVTATYSWFHSSADSYSMVQLRNFDGAILDGENEVAGDPVAVMDAKNGVKYVVTLDSQNENCKITFSFPGLR